MMMPSSPSSARAVLATRSGVVERERAAQRAQLEIHAWSRVCRREVGQGRQLGADRATRPGSCRSASGGRSLPGEARTAVELPMLASATAGRPRPTPGPARRSMLSAVSLASIVRLPVAGQLAGAQVDHAVRLVDRDRRGGTSGRRASARRGPIERERLDAQTDAGLPVQQELACRELVRRPALERDRRRRPTRADTPCPRSIRRRTGRSSAADPRSLVARLASCWSPNTSGAAVPSALAKRALSATVISARCRPVRRARIRAIARDEQDRAAPQLPAHVEIAQRRSRRSGARCPDRRGVPLGDHVEVGVERLRGW